MMHNRKLIGGIIFWLFVFEFCASLVGAYDKVDIENWLNEAESTLTRTDSYTAIFHKQERIKQRLTSEETIFLKFKKSFKVYMKWIKEPYKGRESLYVEGYNDNLIKVRECGIAGMITLNIDPKGTTIMKGSRHPITDSGLETLVKIIKANLKKSANPKEVNIKEHGEEKVFGRTTRKVEIIFPKDKTKNYYCYRVLMNLDVETKVPISVHIYNWDDSLIKSYGYEAIKLHAGLTEADFDPNNSEY